MIRGAAPAIRPNCSNVDVWMIAQWPCVRSKSTARRASHKYAPWLCTPSWRISTKNYELLRSYELNGKLNIVFRFLSMVAWWLCVITHRAHIILTPTEKQFGSNATAPRSHTYRYFPSWRKLWVLKVLYTNIYYTNISCFFIIKKISIVRKIRDKQ